MIKKVVSFLLAFVILLMPFNTYALEKPNVTVNEGGKVTISGNNVLPGENVNIIIQNNEKRYYLDSQYAGESGYEFNTILPKDIKNYDAVITSGDEKNNFIINNEVIENPDDNNSGSDNNSNVPIPSNKITVTLSIDKKTINKGYVIRSTELTVNKGDSVWDVVKHELDKRNISYSYNHNNQYDSVYIESIDGDGEFDHGKTSGWMYNVNGHYPGYGVDKYKLENGDKIQLKYTTNLGKDLGLDNSRWYDSDTNKKTQAKVIEVSSNGNVNIEAIQYDQIINLKSQSKNKPVAINIPKDMESKVYLSLPIRKQLPNISATKNDITLNIPKETRVLDGDCYRIQLLTNKDKNDYSNLLKKESIILSKAISLGNSKRLSFDKHVTITFKNLKGKKVGFIENEKLTPIKIYTKAPKDADVYAIETEEGTVIYTNHFTDFIVYSDGYKIKDIYNDFDKISEWAKDGVERATDLGIVRGHNDKFNPKSNITRAEFTTIMATILKLNINNENTINFKDVNKDNWFYPYVNVCYKYGIVSGDGNYFYPNKTITREQMAAMVSRIINFKICTEKVNIKDINNVSNWAKDSVQKIYNSGLMVGNNGYFDPKTGATREMAVVLAMKCLEVEKKQLTMVKSQVTEILKYIEETGSLLLDKVNNPIVSSVGGEWGVLSLSRSDIKIPDSYYKNYLDNLKTTLENKKGKLHRIKYTEYDRAILALSSMGKDVKDIYGYDLTLPLADFDKVIKQGLNGPIWALIALDSKDYDIPVDSSVSTQTTRDILIHYILEKELSGGGWSLTSEEPADVDITGMALQALSKYQNREDVKQAIDRAIDYLSKVQKSDGSFESGWDISSSSESISQVVVALTSLGINPKSDERFIKNGNDTISALLEFYVEGGGFKHLKNMEQNLMATEQGMYALVAYDRFLRGKSSLYDMRDVK